jgi:hypothetical protein
MSYIIRILKSLFIVLLVVVFTCTGCATAKKTGLNFKRKESLCDLSHLGKNKYYYSTYYQKKLRRSVKIIGGQ